MATMRLIGLALAALLAAGAALAQTQAPGGKAAPEDKVVITNPNWERPPDIQEMLSFYPPAAMAKGLEGQAVIRCKVAVTHLLRECVLISETPPGEGFGNAALAFSATFRMKPQTRNGSPVDGAEVQVPVIFRCPGLCPRTSLARMQSASDVIYRNMTWTSTPTLAEWAAAYPAGARRNPTTAAVPLFCEIGAQGRLGPCNVVNGPANVSGFETAARNLAKQFSAPAQVNGKSTQGGFVYLNIAFPAELATNGRPALADTQLTAAPNSAQIEAAYPAAAREKGIPFGRAAIQCARDKTGGATGCTVVSEEPSGAGFGQAALSLAPNLRFTTWSSDGRMTSTTVRIPFSFGREPEGQESALTLLEIAERAVATKDFATARQYIDQRLQRFPPDEAVGKLLSALAKAAEIERAYDQELWAYTRQLPFSDSKAQIYNRLCWLKAARNLQAETAVADCDEALKLEPDTFSYLDSRALAHLRLGHYSRAIADYDALLKSEPRLAAPLMGRGIAKVRMGDARGGNADIRAAKSIREDVEAQFEAYGLRP